MSDRSASRMIAFRRSSGRAGRVSANYRLVLWSPSRSHHGRSRRLRRGLGWARRLIMVRSRGWSRTCGSLACHRRYPTSAAAAMTLSRATRPCVARLQYRIGAPSGYDVQAGAHRTSGPPPANLHRPALLGVVGGTGRPSPLDGQEAGCCDQQPAIWGRSVRERQDRYGIHTQMRLMGVDHLSRWTGEAGSEPPAGQHSLRLGDEPYT